jgi:hypothetical protein
MDEQDNKKRLLDHVDPNRRSFVRQILGGAAFVAPLIATFSIDSLTAGEPEKTRESNTCAVDDQGYAGPAVFQVSFSDPSHSTHANGTATFTITGTPPFSVQTAEVIYSLFLSPGATFCKAFICSYNEVVECYLKDTKHGVINAACILELCDFDEFLIGLDSEGSKIVVIVDVQGQKYELTGTIKSKGASVITLGP